MVFGLGVMVFWGKKGEYGLLGLGVDLGDGNGLGEGKVWVERFEGSVGDVFGVCWGFSRGFGVFCEHLNIGNSVSCHLRL
jgi:hypothetical protein